MSDKKIDFKEFFRFTKDGKMKSGTVVYSVSYAALYLVVYSAAYYFLIDVLAPISKGLPVWLSDLIGAFVPAVAGTLICMIPVLLISNKKPAFLGYVWLAAFALLFLAAMLILLWEDREALLLFLHLFIIMVPAPLILGGGSAWYIWKNAEKNTEDYD